MTILRVHLAETFPESGIPAMEWALRDERGNLLSQGSDELAKLPGADELELIAPAGVVSFSRVKLPAGKGEKLRRLLPYAVEDRVAGEPDALHVAMGPTLDGETAVAVVDRTWVTRVLRLFASAGLKPRRMLPETLLVGIFPGSWSVVWAEPEGFVRAGECAGQMLDGGAPPLALRLMLDEARQAGRAPERLTVHGDVEGLEQWSETLGLPVVSASGWDWRTADASAVPIDLMQGEFSSRSSLPEFLPRLRPALILLGLIALLQFGGSVADWWRMKSEKQQIVKKMEQDFRRIFPEEKVLIDVPLQMQRKLDGLRRNAGILSENDFIPALARLAPLLDASGQNKVERIDFERGALKVEMLASAGGYADELRRRLQGAGLKAEVNAEPGAKSGGIPVKVTLWLH
ncbi:MAG: type II secretion system protein GspL [Sulfuricella sp.]